MKRRVLIGIGIGFLCVGAGAGAYVLYGHKSNPAVVSGIISKERVEALFKGHTPQEAYVAFVKMNNSNDQGLQHLSAHVFGEVLYAHEGMDGFPVCGPEFGFGCYHGFMGELITQQGIQAVSKLDAACIKSHGQYGLGCFHGIGHGLVSYYGYGEKDLNNALAVCETLSWKGVYGGCADGAFMEYNLRTMQADTGGQNRVFSKSDIDAPCPGVIQQFRPSCYFNEPEWWRQVFIQEQGADIRLVTYCSKISSAEDRLACYRGIGYSYSQPLGFDVAKGAAFCAAFSEYPGAQLGCAEGYAWSLYANDKHDEALQVCAALPATQKDTCKNDYLFVLQLK